jgi:uncharacterized damage-inducible protein DinB
MPTNDLVADAFERVREHVLGTLQNLSQDELTYRPNDKANSIAWLVWHLTRIQDDHIAEAAGTKQIWSEEWLTKLKLPFNVRDTGYGHGVDEVGAVKASARLLAEYHEATYAATIRFIIALKERDYEKVVDRRWDPPVTLAVRLVSVIDDTMQHAGQAAYIRGLLP